MVKTSVTKKSVLVAGKRKLTNPNEPPARRSLEDEYNHSPRKPMHYSQSHIELTDMDIGISPLRSPQNSATEDESMSQEDAPGTPGINRSKTTGKKKMPDGRSQGRRKTGANDTAGGQSTMRQFLQTSLRKDPQRKQSLPNRHGAKSTVGRGVDSEEDRSTGEDSASPMTASGFSSQTTNKALPATSERSDDTSTESDSGTLEGAVDSRRKRSIEEVTQKNVKRTKRSGREDLQERRERAGPGSHIGTKAMISSVESHMADKEFIRRQVALLSQPFSLTSESLELMQSWKDQSEESEDRPLPNAILDNAVRKLNHRLSDRVQLQLSRTKQRHVVTQLGEYRRLLSQSVKHWDAVGDSRTGASLHEILDNYPMEWPHHMDADWNEETMDEMVEKTERYSLKRAQVFALSRSVIESKRELQQCKTLLNLARSAKGLADNCDCDEVKEELQRTNRLLVQVYDKLHKQKISRKSPKKQLKLTTLP